jgi:hypothetical protein
LRGRGREKGEKMKPNEKNEGQEYATEEDEIAESGAIDEGRRRSPRSNRPDRR